MEHVRRANDGRDAGRRLSQRALPAVVPTDQYWAPSMRRFVAASAVGR
jgi:hypothetical protein